MAMLCICVRFWGWKEKKKSLDEDALIPTGELGVNYCNIEYQQENNFNLQ